MQSLYLSYDGMTDQLGQSQVIPYLKKLSEKGNHFTIISFEKKEAFKKLRAETQYQLSESNIEWKPLSYHKSPPVLSTVWDIFLMIKNAKKILTQNKIQVVHCRSYITAIAGLWLKKKWGVKFIFDMRGFWADERVEGKIWKLKNPFYRFIYHYFKRQEKKLLSSADHIITLTEKAKEIIRSWQLKSLPEITVIPCCTDTGHFNPNTININQVEHLRERMGINAASLILGYLGAIGTWYMLEEMLDFFKVLLQTNPKAVFLVVTNEPPQTIQHSANRKGIPLNALVITSASRKDVPLYISLMDVSIFFIKPVFSKQASSPTKMAELMSMGIPVICNAGIGDDDRIIEKTGAGILCYEFNEASYAVAVSKIDVLLQKNKSDLRQIALDYYSLEMGAERYEAVYKSLTK